MPTKGSLMPSHSIDLAETLEAAEAEYLYTRVALIAGLPKNPYLAAVRRDGSLRSFGVAASDSPMNNRICGLRLNDDKALHDLQPWFSAIGAIPRIPVIGRPSEVQAQAARLKATSLRGWTHGQFAADVTSLPDASPCCPTRRIELDDVDAFTGIHANAFRTPKNKHDLARNMFRALIKSDRAEAYAVELDGRDVAVGLVFFAENGVGYLATAATDKAARRQGAHRALIARRIAAARARGCRQIAATALPTSQSRRNLESMGLVLSHIQTLLVVA